MASADTTNSSSVPVPKTFNFKYDDFIVRLFSLATIFWGIAAAILTAWTGLILVDPNAGGIPELAFGRIAGIHLHAAIFAFIGNAIFAGMYYSIQRLCQRSMCSRFLSLLHFAGWQGILIAAGSNFIAGISQRRMLAEFDYDLDLAILAVWSIFALNMLLTIFRRCVRHMYISLWFYIATILMFPIVHALNNLAVLPDREDGTLIFQGVADGFMQGWYVHGLLVSFLTMPIFGLMYYFVPKAVDQPIHNYRLSIVQFWTLVVFGTMSGANLLHLTAVPEWVSSFGMLFGLLFWLSNWAGVMNGLGTIRSAQGGEVADPSAKFFFVAILFFAFASLEGALTSVKSLSVFSLFTDWTTAHIYAMTFGWAGLMSIGMIYWLLPRIYQTNLLGLSFMKAHLWIGSIGVLLLVGASYAAGFTQSSMSHGMDSAGILLYTEYVEITVASVHFWRLAAIGAGLFAVGLISLAVCTAMTWTNRAKPYTTEEQSGQRLGRQFSDEPLPKSAIEGAPVLELGMKIDVATSLQWHRRWERKPFKFTVLTLLLILAASAIQLVPILLFANDRSAITTNKPYTALELAGRQIFVKEGCVNCHSQTVRPIVSETKRYGEISTPVDFAFDKPTQWGMRRVGPDLAQQGGKHDSFWHWQHLENPASVSKGSIMPSYRHILSEPLNLEAIKALVDEAVLQGIPYDSELRDLETSVQAQAEIVAADIVKSGGPAALFDRQATALIAYLQRLGTDTIKAPEVPKTGEGSQE